MNGCNALFFANLRLIALMCAERSFSSGVKKERKEEGMKGRKQECDTARFIAMHPNREEKDEAFPNRL